MLQEGLLPRKSDFLMELIDNRDKEVNQTFVNSDKNKESKPGGATKWHIAFFFFFLF